MTILAGSNAKTGVYSNVGGTGSFSGFGQKYVAAASGVVTDAYAWLDNANLAGGNVVVAIYNSTGASLLGSSAATAITVGGWTHCTVSAGPTLTSGTTYALAIYVSKKVYFDLGNAAFSLAAAVPHYSNPASDPTVSVPATFNLGANYMASNDMAVYVEHNASGVAYNLDAAMGSYSLTGEPAARDLAITAAQASFGLTGKAATLTRAGQVSAAEGPFALTGFDATLTWSGGSSGVGRKRLLTMGAGG